MLLAKAEILGQEVSCRPGSIPIGSRFASVHALAKLNHLGMRPGRGASMIDEMPIHMVDIEAAVLPELIRDCRLASEHTPTYPVDVVQFHPTILDAPCRFCPAFRALSDARHPEDITTPLQLLFGVSP